MEKSMTFNESKKHANAILQVIALRLFLQCVIGTLAVSPLIYFISRQPITN